MCSRWPAVSGSVGTSRSPSWPASRPARWYPGSGSRSSGLWAGLYLLLGVPALLIALGTGAGLLSDHSWDGILTAAVAVAAALLVSLAVGVVQARRMTRLRAAALFMTEDPERGVRVRQGARSAALLRATIGLLSLALIALGALLAT